MVHLSARLGLLRRACVAIAAAVLTLLGIVPLGSAEPVTLRIGHFPNITHVQALVAHGLSRRGRGWFEQRLGPDVKLEWFVYNAGPSAMEAIFADSIDLTYVGPSASVKPPQCVMSSWQISHARAAKTSASSPVQPMAVRHW